jgi:predicted nucleic acid-binding Zn finger protein
MNFGKWDSVIHKNNDQQKRIATAKKSDTTPSTVDRENESAEFKGSGKSVYITTLNSCSCGDFIKRKLPCKHIYRLALELDGAEVKQGINKNEKEAAEFPCDIFELPVESQEMLYDMCVAKIYRGENQFILDRNEFSELLLYKGFCIKIVPTSEHLNNIPVYMMKNVLFSSDIPGEGLPTKKAQRKSVVTCIEKYYNSLAAFINKHFIYLELNTASDKHKYTIHRRLAKIYGTCAESDEDFILEIRVGD